MPGANRRDDQFDRIIPLKAELCGNCCGILTDQTRIDVIALLALGSLKSAGFFG